MQPNSLISKIIQTIIAFAFLALLFIIATGILQIILFFASVIFVFWLLRKIPFIRRHTDNYFNRVVEVKTAEQYYANENLSEIEKDITNDTKVISTEENEEE